MEEFYKMLNAKEVLRKALDNKLITIPEWNEGIFIFIVYRIVWETKSHYIVHALDDEESVKKFVESRGINEYFYEKVKVN